MHELLYKLHAINKKDPLKFSLDNSKKLSNLFGNPEKSFLAVHVAGSNGKGSVAVKVAKGLELSGKKVGLYTSPHIACFRERIKINDCMISEKCLYELLEQAFFLIEENHIDATFFEIATIIALKYFEKSDVDIVVLETGLGGRLDATNIAIPNLAIITSISLEHTDILGNSLEAIAEEKAGIIKDQVPVVIGPNVPRHVIESFTKRKNSPLFQVVGNFDDYHAENCAIAKKALEILKVDSNIIAKAINALPPCRTEEVNYLDKSVAILDVAHNPDGLNQLFKALKKRFPGKEFCVVFGISKNKDIASCLEILKINASRFYFVEAKNERSCNVEELSYLLQDIGVVKERIFTCDSIAKGIDLALQFCSLSNQILVVCGSFFIMAEARKALGIVEERDLLDLNERKLFSQLKSNS